MVEGVPVIDLAGLLDAGRRLFAQLRQAPLRGATPTTATLRTPRLAMA